MLAQQNSNPGTALSEAHTERGTVHSCGHSGAPGDDAQSYGGHSPRPARSQISTVVSFEGAHPAGSAAVASRSHGEDSAQSAAEPEGENSSMPPLQPEAQQFLAQPTTSRLSTAAVRPGSPVHRAPGSPDLHRANSLVSNTEAGPSGARTGRAGTPASVYAQGRVLPTPRTQPSSPQASQAGEQQHSGAGKAHRSIRSSHRGQTGRGQQGAEVHTSASRPPSAARQQDAAASRRTSMLGPGSERRAPAMRHEDHPIHSLNAGNNSIEAVQQGDSQEREGGGICSAEGPRQGSGHLSAMDRQLSWRQAESTAPVQPHPSPNVHPGPLLHPGGGSNDIGLSHGLAPLVAAGSLLSNLLPQVLLQPQASAALDSFLAAGLYHSLPASHSRVHLSNLALGSLPQGAMLPNVQGHSVLGGLSPQNSLHQEAMPSADEAHSAPEPQPAFQQGPEEAHGEGAESVAILPDPSEGGVKSPSLANRFASAHIAREASPSRLGGVSLANGHAHSVQSDGSAPSSRRDPASQQVQGGSEHAQVVGSIPWDTPSAAVQGAESGWIGQQQLPHEQAYSYDQQEAAHPAASVHATVVNEGDVASMDNDVRSLQPSGSQGSGGSMRNAPSIDRGPSFHGSVLPTRSANGEPAMAVANGYPDVEAKPQNASASHEPLQPMDADGAASQAQHLDRTLQAEDASFAGQADAPQISLGTAQPMTDLLGPPQSLPIPMQGAGSAAEQSGCGCGLTGAQQNDEAQSIGLPPLSPAAAGAPRPLIPHLQASRGQRNSSPATSNARSVAAPRTLPADAHGSFLAQTPTSAAAGRADPPEPAQENSLSGGFPAAATLRSSLDLGPQEQEAPAVQSQPSAINANPPGPQPALTIVLPGGLVGPGEKPDDGAAGPQSSAFGHRATSNGRVSANSAANGGTAFQAVTSPSRTPSGRLKGGKRKRTASADSLNGRISSSSQA